MRIMTAVSATMLAALMMLSATGNAQEPQKPSALTVAGYAGEAKLVQIKGKSYVEVESLARLTHGTLSFKANRTILTLPPSGSGAQISTRKAQASTPQPQPPAPQAKAGLSRAFIQAGIEEMGLIREWRDAIVSAVQNNIPLTEEWASAQQRQAEKNLALASAAASTDDDRNAFTLLSAELGNIQKLNDQYIELLKQSTAMSPDKFDEGPLEEQILNCAQGFVSMTESRGFQDQPSCY